MSKRFAVALSLLFGTGLGGLSTPGEKEAAAAGFGGLYSEKPDDDANGLSAISMNEMMQKMVVQQAATHKQEVI